jgi:hypothetical protein
MAARYWVGGTDNWNATAGSKWSTTSGGAGGSAVPTAADDVYIDANAGGNVTVSVAAVCRSLNFVDGTGGVYAGTFTVNAGIVISIGDATAGAGSKALTLSASATYSYGNSSSGYTITSTSVTQQTITHNGKSSSALIIAGAGGSILLADALTSASLTHNAGTFDSGNYNITTTGAFAYGNATVRTLSLGSSVLTIGTNFSGTSTSNMTISANTAVVNMANANPNINLTTNAQDWNGISFSVASTGTVVFTSASTGNTIIHDFTLTPGAVKTAIFSIAGNLTLDTLTLNSNSDVNNLLFASSIRGTARTITAAALVCTNRVDFMDIVGAGAATWTVGASGASFFGDCGGNSGITMNTPVAQTISSGTWDNVANWTSRIPLPQDDVTLTGSGAITLNMQRFGKSIDMSAYTGTLTATTSGSNYDFFGSITLGSGMSWGASPNTFNIVASGRGSYTITSNGKLFFPANSNSSFTINAPTGTYSLADDLDARTPIAASFIIAAGSFVTNNYACALGRITGIGAITRSATWGTSSVSLYATASGISLIVLAATGLTWSADNATFTVVNTTANTRVLDLAGYTIGTFDYSVTGSTGPLTMAPGRVKLMKFSDTTNARTLQMSGAGAYIDDWSQVFGRSGALISVISTAGGTRRTVGSYASTQQTLDYATVTDIQFVTGNKLFVTNGTDGGNNRNITFTAPTGGIFQIQQDAVSGTGVTTLTDTFPVPTTAGKLLIAVIGWTANPGAITFTGWTLAKAWNRTVSAVNTVPYGVIYYKIAVGTETTISPSWANSTTPTFSIQEVTGFLGVPTLDSVQDNNDTVSATSLVTSAGGAGVTPTAVPAYAFAAVVGNGGMGITTTAATNSFYDNYEPNLQVTGTVLHTASRYMSVSAAVSTTLSWTASRVPVAALVFFYDLAGNNYTQSLNDTASTVDTDVVSFGKVLSNNPSSTDAAIKAVSKLFNETATATDAQVKRVAKYLVDGATTSDQLTSVVGYIRNLADSATVSDAISTNLYILVSQIISATLESDNKNLTVNDDNLGVILESDDKAQVIENEVI